MATDKGTPSEPDLWVSVEDRLPEKLSGGREFSAEVIVAYEHTPGAWYVGVNSVAWFNGYPIWKGPDPSHWMPLPNPPGALAALPKTPEPPSLTDGQIEEIYELHDHLRGKEFRRAIGRCFYTRGRLEALASRAEPPVLEVQGEPSPIDMVLHCPKCGTQHVDAPDVTLAISQMQSREPWSNPPHRSHLCHHCGVVWRPADVPTNGVAAVKTTGKADSPLSSKAPVPQSEPADEAAHRKALAMRDAEIIRLRAALSEAQQRAADFFAVVLELRERSAP